MLVFVGDPAQLSSVGAGGWFRHVVYSDGAPSLSKIYRQQGDDMAEVREALKGLRSQMPERVRAAMGRLAADGRVRVFDDADTLLLPGGRRLVRRPPEPPDRHRARPPSRRG